MKLNDVIILNRQHMRDFFSFPEFMTKRKEFIEIVDNDVFFKPKDKINNKIYLKAQVKNWINRRPLLEHCILEHSNIVLPTGKVLRNYSMGCEEELSQLSPEDAFGISCLYELIERKLKQDIYEIMAFLGYEINKPENGIMILTTNKELELFDENKSHDQGLDLNSVLLVSCPPNHIKDLTITLGNTSIHLRAGECTRALFYGDECIKILPLKQKNVSYYFIKENFTNSILIGDCVLPKENVLAFACGEQGFVYSVKANRKEKKFISRHRKISDDGFFYNPLENSDEDVIYIELSPKENRCIFLTNKKRLYCYDSDNEDEIKLKDENVIMATFSGNEIKTLKI